MQKSINGEVYNLSLERIKYILKSNFNVSIKDKSIEEIYIENEDCYIDMYDNSAFMKNTFLIGGVYKGEEYHKGIEFINKLANLFLEEKVSFELEIESDGNIYNIKNRLVKMGSV